jgi:hypothetical protein
MFSDRCEYLRPGPLEPCGAPGEITILLYRADRREEDVTKTACRKHITPVVVDEMRPGARRGDALDRILPAVWPTWMYEAHR